MAVTEIEVDYAKTLALENLKILVVEDTPDIQLLLSRTLEKRGAIVQTVGNGSDALPMVRQGDFDVVIMDIQLPVMSGYEATQTLRAEGITVPIIAVTSNEMYTHRQKTLDAGCNAYVSKPIDVSQLVRTILQNVRRS